MIQPFLLLLLLWVFPAEARSLETKKDLVRHSRKSALRGSLTSRDHPKIRVLRKNQGFVSTFASRELQGNDVFDSYIENFENYEECLPE